MKAAPLGRMTRYGWLPVREGCQCGFCRTVRAGVAEIEIRSLAENLRRTGNTPPPPRKRPIV